MIKELTPEETGRWMDAAPLVVQETAASQEMIEAVQRIGRAHSLHVDLIGILANLTRYMLIGHVTPPEAFQELQSAGVAEQEARQILNEVNQSVFMPLHDRMRRGGAMPANSRTQAPPPRYGPPAPPAPRPTQPPPTPSQYVPPPPLPRPALSPRMYEPSPLPPRHILPTPGTPVFHRPPPPPRATEGTAMPPWPLERSEPIPPTSPWAPPPPQATDGHGTKGAVPMNLPTGIPLPPAPRPAPAESFYEFPPLARPVPPPLSSIPDGNTPHTRYPSDPYREQPE